MAQFNEEFYLENNPEALASEKTAFEHFVTEGWESGALANAEGEVLTGDDIVIEAVALPGDALLSLVSEMGADDMRAVDAGSAALDVPALMITSFDVFKNMDASETAQLVEDTPESLAIMEVDDFQFLESGGTFDVGQTMDGLDESTTADVLKGLGGEALGFVDAKETYDMGAKLTAMGDENLATVMGGLEVDGMTFMDGMDDFDMGAEMAAMDDQYMASMMGNFDQDDLGFFDSMDDFDLAGELGGMDDQYLGSMLGQMDADGFHGWHG